MNTYFAKLKADQGKEMNGAHCFQAAEAGEIDLKGAYTGVNHVFTTEYPPMGVHDDNEGFYVIAGHGRALVGDEEQAIEKGSSFFAPAGVAHALKKDPDSEDMEVFWFHFPV